MKKGFTLIEALVTLTLIGIVTILVIPSLNNSFNKKTYTVALQKQYSAVSDAVKQLMVDERASSMKKTYLYDEEEDVANTAGRFIKKYFTIERDCGSSMTPCFADSYKNIDMDNITDALETFMLYCAKTSFGGSMCISTVKDNFVYVFVDVNGAKKPNTAGRDLFVFYIYDDGFVGDRIKPVPACYNSSYSQGCFTKLKNNDWVMDY